MLLFGLFTVHWLKMPPNIVYIKMKYWCIIVLFRGRALLLTRVKLHLVLVLRTSQVKVRIARLLMHCFVSINIKFNPIWKAWRNNRNVLHTKIMVEKAILTDFRFHTRWSLSVVFLSCVYFVCDCQFYSTVVASDWQLHVFSLVCCLHVVFVRYILVYHT